MSFLNVFPPGGGIQRDLKNVPCRFFTVPVSDSSFPDPARPESGIEPYKKYNFRTGTVVV